MSGTKYVDSEVGPPGHGAGMLPRRRLPAAATCKPPEPSEEWGEGRLGGRRVDGRAPAGRDSGQRGAGALVPGGARGGGLLAAAREERCMESSTARALGWRGYGDGPA